MRNEAAWSPGRGPVICQGRHQSLLLWWGQMSHTSQQVLLAASTWDDKDHPNSPQQGFECCLVTFIRARISSHHLLKTFTEKVEHLRGCSQVLNWHSKRQKEQKRSDVRNFWTGKLFMSGNTGSISGCVNKANAGIQSTCSLIGYKPLA